MAPGRTETIASRIGFPGLVLMTGVGWLLLLDLSANGQPRQSLSRALPPGTSVACDAHPERSRVPAPASRAPARWCLSVLDGVASGVGRRVGRAGGAALFALAAILLLVGAVRILLANVRQLTSEIGRSG